MSKVRKAGGKRHNGWLIAGVIVGVLILGGMLARWSPVAVALVFLIVAGLAIFVLFARPLPKVGLHSRRAGVTALGLSVLLLIGGGVASASTIKPDAPIAAVSHRIEDAPQPSKPSATPKPVPTVLMTTTEKSAIVFERTTANDAQRDQGTNAIVTAGSDGVLATTYRVTRVDGVEVSREIVSEIVEVEPVTEVTAIGTRAPAPKPVPLVQQNNSGCDSNYTGACVPVASDVDCAGGSGNGPAYVSGPVRIVGSDIYDLDRDGDGIACD